MDYIKIKGLPKDEVIGLVKEWIKLYPHSFNPEVNLWFCELADNQVVIGLHDDMSTLAVSLLVIYLTSAVKDVAGGDVVAYLTVDDNEILLKQNYGRRAKIVAKDTENDNTGVLILLDNDYCVDYYFRGKAHPVKNHELVFEESDDVKDIENTAKDEIRVGDIVPKQKIDHVVEPESPWKKLMWYVIFGAIGLSIGFLIVYLYH